MKNESFVFWAVFIFTGVCLMHVVRLIGAMHVYVDGQVVPMWLSAVAVLVSGCMVVSGVKLLRK